MISDNLKKYEIQWLITEYQEIRKEIERRSKEQFICITGSIISLGSTLAFISKDPSISCIIAYIFMRFGNIAKLPIPIEIFLLIIGVIFIICLIISWFRATKVILK